MSLNNAEGWEYARESLKYHGDKLADIRKITTCQLTCLVKIYIFLHEARKNDFCSPKLQEKRNKAMLAKLTTQRQNLQSAICGRLDEAELLRNGLRALEIHRSNHEGNGVIKQL